MPAGDPPPDTIRSAPGGRCLSDILTTGSKRNGMLARHHPMAAPPAWRREQMIVIRRRSIFLFVSWGLRLSLCMTLIGPAGAAETIEAQPEAACLYTRSMT